jgi:glycosyltransferase involved in cell wall biosynthesis
MAVAHDYLKIGNKLNPNVSGQVVYWGINDTHISDEPISELVIKFCKEKVKTDIWLIYAGTLGENYDIKSIIGLGEKSKVFSNIKFLIAGDGPLRDFVIQKIDKSHLANVIYFGRLNHSDLKYLYKFCDLAISSYSVDSTVSMPIKAFDFFKYGIPVLNSLGRDFGRIISEKYCGLNYQPENVDDMFDKLKILISDKPKLEQMRLNAIDSSKDFDSEIQYKIASIWLENVLLELKRKIV